MDAISNIVNEMLTIARGTGVFNPVEMDILEEVASDCVLSPQKGYKYVQLREGAELLGFVIYGATPLTANTWDMYWLVVKVSAQRKGVGKRLVQLTEAEILGQGIGNPVIRLETSSRDEYAPARGLYTKCGYRQVGFIQDFYRPGDSLVTFARMICRGV